MKYITLAINLYRLMHTENLNAYDRGILTRLSINPRDREAILEFHANRLPKRIDLCAVPVIRTDGIG